MKFRSIKIIHDIKHRIDFSYLAEFFRFMGILVCENILQDTDESEAEKNTHYDAYIYVGKCENSGEEDYAQKLQSLPEKTIFLYKLYQTSEILGESLNEDNRRTCIKSLSDSGQQITILKELLTEVLSVVNEDKDAGTSAAGQLQELIKVYVNNDICLHSMNMQYYMNRKENIISDARNAFLDSRTDINGWLEENEKKIDKDVVLLYRYAVLWCEVKANSACSYNRETLEFSIENLAGRIAQLCKEYPDFVNAQILQGLCYEPSGRNAVEAIDAFLKALSGMGTQCFSSSVYYWIGKRYEQRKLQEDAEWSYKCAYEKKKKFRNIYKLAIFAKNGKRYAEAIDKFDEILQRLKLKNAMDFTDPLELEYMFKAYTQKCHVYYLTDQIIKAVENGERARRVWKDRIENNLYYKCFYNEEAAFYRELTEKRLALSTVCWILVDCYGKLLNSEKVEECRKEAIENEEERK